MDKLKTILFKIVVRTFDALDLHAALARLSARYVKEIHPNNKRERAVAISKEGVVTILVLDYDRYRGDIDIFSEEPEIRCLEVSPTFLQYLLASFVRELNKKEKKEDKKSHAMSLGERWDFARPESGGLIEHDRKRYREFLEKFLPKFYDIFGIKIVMNSDYRYRRETDVTRVSAKLNYPHICFYREALYIVSAHYKNAVYRNNFMGGFHEHIVAVQNNITRDIFIEANIVQEKNIHVRGCPRMDDFFKKIQMPKNNDENKRKQVSFFSFPRGAQLEDLSYFEFFDISLSVIRTLARLAVKRQDVDFVIKMKEMHINQLDYFNREIKNIVGDLNKIKNLVVSTERMAAQDIILSSDVICSMQSTVVLEAAVANKPVVMPHFKSLTCKPRVDEVLMYREYTHLFDVPDDEEELEGMILTRLEDGEIPKVIMDERRKVFEKYISPLSGGATKKCISLIKNMARNELKINSGNS